MSKEPKITCVVDNAVQPGSCLRGEHGLAFLIEIESGRVLFDTGQSGAVLLHNLDVLEIEPESIDALAISHAHYDHTGGLPALLGCTHPGLPLYANPDLFRERFSHRGDELKSIGMPLAQETLQAQIVLHLSVEPQQILPGIWTTGVIASRPEPMGSSPHHMIREGNNLIPDPYQDDMALVIEGSAGLILLCGCCHAGLLNTLMHTQRHFGKAPVAVLGGTHLLRADGMHLSRLVEVLREMGSPVLHLNHCTGQAAFMALAKVFGDRVSPCPAGTHLGF